MSVWFADTFYWIALLNAKDEMHEFALELNNRLRGEFVTTQWVLAELMDGCADMAYRAEAAPMVRTLKRMTNVTIVPATDAWFERGITLYESRADKEWLLTDCISILVMQERRISEALTADHHFEQAGFTVLFK